MSSSKFRKRSKDEGQDFRDEKRSQFLGIVCEHTERESISVKNTVGEGEAEQVLVGTRTRKGHSSLR